MRTYDYTFRLIYPVAGSVENENMHPSFPWLIENCGIMIQLLVLRFSCFSFPFTNAIDDSVHVFLNGWNISSNRTYSILLLSLVLKVHTAKGSLQNGRNRVRNDNDNDLLCSLAGLIQVFSDKFASISKSSALVAYPIHFVLLNTIPTTSDFLKHHEYNIIWLLRVPTSVLNAYKDKIIVIWPMICLHRFLTIQR